MLHLTLEKLRLIIKNRNIKGYKTISKDKLLNLSNAPELKWNKTVKDNAINNETIRDIHILFEPDRKDYHEPIRNKNAFNKDYIEYESNGNKEKTLSIEKDLYEITLYLNKIINDLKTQGKWKTQLLTAINFLPTKDNNDTRVMDSKSDNIEIVIGNEADEISHELFDSFTKI